MRIAIGKLTSVVVCSVISLTLTLMGTSCSYVEKNLIDDCKNRAFIGTDVKSFVTSRFNSPEAVRLGIIPYSSAANLSPEVGRMIATRIHQEILPTGDFPVVEIFNRQDWPGKQEEFYSGNFGAISLAREAQYDLVMVGMVTAMTRLDELVVDTKVIEAESGTTVYYARTAYRTHRDDIDGGLSWLGISNRTPSQLPTAGLIDRVARCIVHGMRKAD